MHLQLREKAGGGEKKRGGEGNEKGADLPCAGEHLGKKISS